MRLSVLSALLLAAPLFAQQFPEVEPNDTPGTAQAVPLGSQVNSSIGVANDVDWYSFTTPGGYHGISTSGGATAVLDLVMALHDSTGTTCIAWNDDAQSSLPSIWMNLAAGTYTVRVIHFSTTTGSYSLDISHPMSKPLNGAEVEPNNTIATANLVGDGAQLGAALTPPVMSIASGSVAAATIVTSGAVASSTTTVITTVGALTAGTWNGVGYFVRFTSGIHTGLSRRITANTATTITTESWGTAPAATDTFDVITGSPTVLTDTVASATTTVITSTAALTAGAFTFAGTTSHAVRMTSGANVGLSRTISSNTATTITTASWPVANSPGDTYIVVAGGATTAIIPTTPPAVGLYNDQAFWLRCTSGANSGQSRCILNNTAEYIGLVVGFTNAPAPGDTFEIDQYDVDTYQVTLTSLSEVVFSVTDGDNTFVTGFSYVVVDGAGNRINATTLATNLADSGTFANRVSSFRVWPTGTYYVRIMQRRTPHNQPAPTVAYGNYRFELKQRTMSTGSTAEAEPVGTQTNNTIFAAELLTPGQAHSGNITNSAGTDPSDYWGPITVAQPTLVTFQVSMGGAPALGDATCNLRQVTDPILGTTAATALTGGNILETGSLNPRGSFNLLLPGTIYYLEVLSPGAGATQAGNYLLECSTLDVPTYTAGNFAAVAANATGCGTAGVPTINRVQGSTSGAAYGELPIAGQTLVTRTTNLNGVGNFGLMLMGVTGALGPVYNPVPVDLTGMGAPGCTLNVNPVVIDILFGDATGTADHVILCPGNLALAGFTVFMQPCKWDFATPINPLGIQPGNWLRLIFGTRTF